MKKVCFIEMEGVLLSDKDYRVNERRAKSFVEGLSMFCREHAIDLYLVTGFHEPVAHQKLNSGFLKDFFDDAHFLHVDEAYIKGKGEEDERIHRGSLEKNPEFNDSYFKQVVMQQVLAEKHLFPRDALLLSDDIWVDGYYTARFSKVDFALFEENILDRGRKADMISGLAYFNLDFASVKPLLENFPKTSFAGLDKYVFDSMKKALLGDAAMGELVKAVREKRIMQQKSAKPGDGGAPVPDETLVFDGKKGKAEGKEKGKGKKKR